MDAVESMVTHTRPAGFVVLTMMAPMGSRSTSGKGEEISLSMLSEVCKEARTPPQFATTRGHEQPCFVRTLSALTVRP